LAQTFFSNSLEWNQGAIDAQIIASHASAFKPAALTADQGKQAQELFAYMTHDLRFSGCFTLA